MVHTWHSGSGAWAGCFILSHANDGRMILTFLCKGFYWLSLHKWMMGTGGICFWNDGTWCTDVNNTCWNTMWKPPIRFPSRNGACFHFGSQACFLLLFAVLHVQFFTPSVQTWVSSGLFSCVQAMGKGPGFVMEILHLEYEQLYLPLLNMTQHSSGTKALAVFKQAVKGVCSWVKECKGLKRNDFL